MKIITVGTLKGGTGKTVFTFNLAGYLADVLNKKVLLVDSDPQSNLSTTVGVDVTNQNIYSIRSIYNNDEDAPIDELIIKQPIQRIPNLDIISSCIQLTASEMMLSARSGREYILSHYFQDNKETLDKYDYIFIDTNPSMGIINQNAFYVADDIVLISDVDIDAVQGAEVFIALWTKARRDLRKEDNVSALVINNYDKQLIIARDLVEYCASSEDFAPLLIPHPIPATKNMKETKMKHSPIHINEPDSPATAAIAAIAVDLEERGIL
jgi:chromosome partitioning protein